MTGERAAHGGELEALYEELLKLEAEAASEALETAARQLRQVEEAVLEVRQAQVVLVVLAVMDIQLPLQLVVVVVQIIR